MSPPDAPWDVVVVGSINIDYTVRADALPRPGETVRGTELQVAFGGKGANQAVAVSRLGRRVGLIGRVGDDAVGYEVLEGLRGAGVDVERVAPEPHLPTGAALITVDPQGQKQITFAPGANARVTVEDVRSAAGRIRAAKALVVQLEIPLEPVIEALRIAHTAGVMTVLDPAPALLLSDEVYQLVDAIKPNAHEAEALTGIPVHDRDTARQAGKRLLSRGVLKIAAVSAGDTGNLLLTADEEHWLPRIPVRSVDATGAGDAFTAALAVSLIEGRSPGEAGRCASAAAALATTATGAWAGMANRQQIEDLLSRQQ